MFEVFWQIQVEVICKVSSIHLLHGTMSGLLSLIVDKTVDFMIMDVVLSHLLYL